MTWHFRYQQPPSTRPYGCRISAESELLAWRIFFATHPAHRNAVTYCIPCA